MTIGQLVALDELAAISAEWRTSGKRLVLTNGCFDLLHVGHVHYLAEAREVGDGLVVAVNSDESVRQLKGPDRPINSERDRAEVLRHLRSVDFVVVFSEVRVSNVIRAIRPAVYVKGGDYTPETLDSGEREALVECGAEVRILSLVPGKSTTAMLSAFGSSSLQTK